MSRFSLPPFRERLIGTTWEHFASKRRYTITSFATIQMTGPLDMAWAVIYTNASGPSELPWVRPCSEFFDGRFIKVKTSV
jgi:hypothetical protein